MKPAAVAAELRKAQAGTIEDQRLALARMRLARLRQAKAAPKPANGLGSLRVVSLNTNNPRAGIAAVKALMRHLDTDARRPRR